MKPTRCSAGTSTAQSGEEGKMGRYKYGMRLRGFSPGCQPRGVVDHEDGSGRYFDFIFYDRKLTDAEEHDYELDYLGEEET